MRVKRYKKFQRYMGFFQKQFHFQPPFQILVDGTFANAALVNKVNMREQLPKYFDGPCKLLTTPCVVIETEQLGPSLYGAVKVLKELQIHKCDHLANPVPASRCLKSIASKNAPRKSAKKDASKEPTDHFIIATQDGNLRLEFREIIGIPLLYLYGSAPTMEKPSDKSVSWADKRDKRKLEVSDYHKEILKQMKEEVLPRSNNEGGYKGTKKRKRAGPNPLSCKKSKKAKGHQSSHQPATASTSHVEKEEPKKRKRIKVRVPKHVKELTSNTKQ